MSDNAASKRGSWLNRFLVVRHRMPPYQLLTKEDTRIDQTIWIIVIVVVCLPQEDDKTLLLMSSYTLAAAYR